MRKGMAWLAGLGLALVVAACDSGTGGDLSAASSADVQGKWYIKRMQEKGTLHMVTQAVGTVPAKDTTINLDKDTTYTGTDNYMQFNADGTFASSQPSPLGGPAITASGTWKLDGKTMTITETAPQKIVSTTTVGLSGGDLVSVMTIDTTSTSAYLTQTLKVTITTTASK